MITNRLRGLGLSSDVLNGLGLASILASITIWSRAQHDDAGHGERSAIFVGLWAPAFFVLASSMVTAKQAPRAKPPPTEKPRARDLVACTRLLGIERTWSARENR